MIMDLFLIWSWNVKLVSQINLELFKNIPFDYDMNLGTGVLLGPRYRSKQSGGKNPKTADLAESFRFEWGFFFLYTLISGEIRYQELNEI